ncbi:UDP-glucose/GDP-mannose dehydrogenase family protein [Neomegalonema sp.]|uniref:UDP-glucose dehydrogenase family protein n=1 Tax=Neomegalonema sp. TaxID=2039713 RepID=UPI0026044EE5|nr:UDP-glucose/GDP-mannose dehydrogenase family protein [Neomegalonema sp.]MDD2868587.1 UDP-glucose/GDP-mannose dehydrogenase family protein [Neomegalonema sp.]
MRVAMIGSGYVGLVSGACFADFGHEVVCVDSAQEKIEALNQGVIPIYEPGLAELVAANARAGRLSFTTDLPAAVARAEVVFIAVGTPSRRGDGHADLSHVRAAAREVARALKGFTVVAVKSTVPVGTGDEVERILRETRPDAEFAVASNPEFLREGAAIADFKRPDRIVVGAEDPRAEEVMRELYRPLHLNSAPLFFCDRRTSELIKYASNAFLAMKISFINEMADLCERVGADVQDLARGVGMDKRIGDRFLQAGPGYGGSCFPKDTLAVIKTAQDHDMHLRLIEAAAEVNEQRKRAMGRKIAAACGLPMRGKTVALLGLTFKPDTDDMRDSPSLPIIQALQDMGAHVRAYDPEGVEAARALVEGVEFVGEAHEAARGADALVLVTEWDEFRALDFRRLKSLMKAPVFVDLRNVYPPEEVLRHGFAYEGVGRKVDHALVRQRSGGVHRPSSGLAAAAGGA